MPRSQPHLLYITLNGLLDHLGFSQVVRVVERLAQRGHRYSIVSLEHETDLADQARVQRLSARLAEAGVRWSYQPYRTHGRGYVARNQLALQWLALKAIATQGITHVHARSYQSGLIAELLPRPWLFDARGYFIDERIEDGRWFTTPRRVAAARALERHLYRSAERVVTLTELQAHDLTNNRFGCHAEHVTVIPTCADYEEFHPRAASGDEPLTVGIVGSSNPRAYLTHDSARFAAVLARREPSLRFHVISGQHQEWRALLEAHGVPGERIVAGRANHEEMPERLRALDWMLLLLTPPSRAKRGAMPTKLAECLASGVRVCMHGCNEEMYRWGEQVGGNLLLHTLDDPALERAAEALLAQRGVNLEARTRSAEHFSLERGIERYDQLLREWTRGAGG